MEAIYCFILLQFPLQFTYIGLTCDTQRKAALTSNQQPLSVDWRSRGGRMFPRSSHNWPVVVATSFRARVTTGQSWWPQVSALESQLASRGGHKFPRSSHNWPVVVATSFRARVTTGQSWWPQVSALEPQLASRGGHKFPRSSHNWPVVVATSFRARVTTGQSWWPRSSHN
ncbi:hypothetical protein RRG08_036172 [Elysia crispata]|uniref:Uncharacterized protein n=1 Tax=Elysia crispata TaxID=231223 RepID=A0AAE1CEP5_9GAST|nr:hypothetical protein RRG08_036172 [Elysia crispata]